ncbi:hypothetical protein GCM10027258_70890 [Amycolatopsis stemonae]
MTFDTYHWQGVHLGDAPLDEARAELESSRDPETVSRAFLTLLRSDRTAAIGVALDHYDYAEMSSRHGTGNPYSPFAGEVLDKARQLLRQAPLPADESGIDEAGANHASALGAMLNLAEETDAEPVASALAGATGVSVREAGLSAACTVMERSTTPNPVLAETLTGIVHDAGRPGKERAAALDALAGSAADQITEVLLRALEIDDLDVQVSAAFNLAHLDSTRFHPLLERLVATWPANVPYPGSEVIDMLHESSSKG